MEERLKNYGWLANLLVLAICAWLAAGVVATLIAAFWGADSSSAAPPILTAPAPSTLAELPGAKEAILQRNLFGRNLTETEETAAIDPDLPGGIPAVKTDLKMVLLGTVVTPDPNKSIASVQLEKGPRRVHVGEKLTGAKADGKHTVRNIERGRVEFVNEDSRRLEYLAFAEREPPKLGRRKSNVVVAERPPGSGITQNSDNEFTIDQKEWDQALANLDRLLTDARAVPNINPDTGKTEGFRVLAVRPDSLYQKLGIQNGDILSVVNGQQLDSINKAMTMFEGLKGEKNFEINIRRGGSPRVMKYQIR